MQMDFHYYATYCAAFIAGYSHEESQTIAYSAQFVDCCTRTLIAYLHGPLSAATTQLQLEMMEAKTDPVGLQDITRIWASFHFLPYDLNAEVKKGGRRYRNKYRLLCGPNGPLVKDTVMLAKASSYQAVGIAMHVLADTWAHRYFAGTPSYVLNNTGDDCAELREDGEKKISFIHNPTAKDDIENAIYTNSIHQVNENTIMNLGHGRAGHLPDYSFIKYKYMPAWGGYGVVIKDNPSEYYMAFAQMVYAMRYLRGAESDFDLNKYAYEVIVPYEARIRGIIEKRQLIACADWAQFCEELSGRKLDDFDIATYQKEYINASKEAKGDTFLGQYFVAAMRHKSMVTNKIFKSGSLLAGYSFEYSGNHLKGIRDYFEILKYGGTGAKV